MRRVAAEVGFVAEPAGAFAGGEEILVEVGAVGSARIICGASI